jgi:tRNA 2-thiouridine synthesizing protein A
MASSPTSSSPPPAPWSGDVLDLTGEVCPFTFVRTKLALEALPAGATLRVLVDHPPAATNVPRSASAWGQTVLGVTALPDARWAIDLQKT